MRVPLALSLIAMTMGCNGDATDTDTDSGTLSVPDTHPLAPEKYAQIWNTDRPCQLQDGGDGTQIYWYSEDAESVVQGEKVILTATEKWYWFHGGFGDDCVDTWELRAEFVKGDYALYGCSECEEAYYFRRTLVDQTCPYLYHQIFGYDKDKDAPDPQVYEGYMLLDTHNTFNGAPNENNKMLMVARYRVPGGSWSTNNNYSKPGWSYRHADDADVQGPPSTYEWVGESCVGSSDGGGT
ncbi:MAG: hypothetical protein ACI9MC_000533 [Kiritimatiellia bacterium]|jgi:hypothetical protein